MTTKQFTISIPGVRPSKKMFSTYEIHDVPDIGRILTLSGDYKWSGVSVNTCKTPWETFKTNPDLWSIVNSPTSCYVDIDEEPDFDTGRIIFTVTSKVVLCGQLIH